MPALAVVPAYNEEETVAEVVRRLAAVGLPALVVDDGSVDGTAHAAAAAGARVLRLASNVGVGAALRTGFAYAVRRGWKEVVIVDADLQHEPEAALRLLEGAREGGHELVIGSRFGDGSYPVSWSRRWMMRRLASLVSRRVGVHLDDVTSGFRAIREPLLSEFASRYPAEYLGDTVEAILLADEVGASVSQMPVAMADRQGGRPTPRLHAAGHLARLLVVLAMRSRS